MRLNGGFNQTNSPFKSLLRNESSTEQYREQSALSPLLLAHASKVKVWLLNFCSCLNIFGWIILFSVSAAPAPGLSVGVCMGTPIFGVGTQIGGIDLPEFYFQDV